MIDALVCCSVLTTDGDIDFRR